MEEEYLTVWHYITENDSGCAEYCPSRYTAILAGNTENRSRTRQDAEDKRKILRGFFFAEDGMAKSAFPAMIQRENEYILHPGQDYVARGDFTAYASPQEALSACEGLIVYCVQSEMRPPQISDGALVDWCHFEAWNDDGLYGV